VASAETFESGIRKTVQWYSTIRSGSRTCNRARTRNGAGRITRPGRPLKILLFGKNGQVGWELQRSLAPLGEIPLSTGRTSRLFQATCSTPGPDKHDRIIRPDVIVNAAAHTAVDRPKAKSNWLTRSTRQRLGDGEGNRKRAERCWSITAPTTYSTDLARHRGRKTIRPGR